jgi:hypothetical protein
MAKLVRVLITPTTAKNFSDVLAKKAGLTVLDESITNPDGTLRGESRASGRPNKKKTTVAQAAAEKAADKKEQDQ